MRKMFSKNQIKEIVNQGLLNEDVKVKTIEQSEPNFEFNLDLSNLNGLPQDCEVEDVYTKIVQWNRELHIVFNFKITNNGESATTGFTSTSNYIDLPEEVAERIIDFAGKSVAESSAGVSICAGVYNEGSQNYPEYLEALQRAFVIKNTGTANRMMLNIHDISAINPTKSLFITGRISLDLA